MSYTNIVENQTFNTQLSVNTSDTWVRNCIIENVTVGQGIRIRGCSNVLISNCTIRNNTGYGILLSGEGGTDRVTVQDCLIHDTGLSGIHAAQPEGSGVFHTNAIFRHNEIYNSGNSDLHHNIYSQAINALIEGNTCHGTDGNNISIRVPSTIRGNICYDSGKASIRYFSDHDKGAYNTVTIENNIIWNDDPTTNGSPLISLLDETSAPDSYIPDTFIIRFNTVWSLAATRHGIKVESAVFGTKAVQVYGNLVINTADGSKTISPTYISYLSRNYTASAATNFINSSTPPYNLRLLSGHAAINYAAGEPAYPPTDIDGRVRSPLILDAGAYQFSITGNNVMYPTTKNNFFASLLSGNPSILLLKDTYTLDLTDVFLADIAPTHRVAIAALANCAAANGVFTADDLSVSGLTGSGNCNALVVFDNTGNENTSRIYGYMSEITSFPFVLTSTPTQLNLSCPNGFMRVL